MDGNDKIERGSVVSPKAGGPIMTVVGNEVRSEVRCNWFTSDGHLQEGSFPVSALDVRKPLLTEDL